MCLSIDSFTIYWTNWYLCLHFPEILTCPKRCKLIMQVLKITNAKTEAVAMAKLQVWWHFVWLLGPKASANFEQASFHTTRFEFSVREEFLSWFIFIEFQEFFGFHKFFIISMFYISVSIFLIVKSNLSKWWNAENVHTFHYSITWWWFCSFSARYACHCCSSVWED